MQSLQGARYASGVCDLALLETLDSLTFRSFRLKNNAQKGYNGYKKAFG